MKRHSRFEKARICLLFWCLFVGVGAVAGALGMLVAPDGSALGMQAMLPSFQVLPFSQYLFQNFVFPGIALLCVNGLTNLLAAFLIHRRRDAGVILGGVFGVTLMMWITIQFVIFPFNFLSTAYFIFGAAQAVTGYAAWVFCRQERFAFRAEDYPSIGKNPKELVVYFSRMGYTRKIAYETAERTGADIWEIRALEPTAGTKGFWWCGRFGMHRWAMPIEKCPLDLSHYDKVTICSPVWVFGLSSPVRAFCADARGMIRRADYVLVHHQNSRYENVFAEMDALLGLRREGARSIRCHVGTYHEIPAAGAGVSA